MEHYGIINKKGVLFMKKIIFGIALIIFAIWLLVLESIDGINVFFQYCAVILPIIGIGFSIWGLFEEE